MNVFDRRMAIFGIYAPSEDKVDPIKESLHEEFQSALDDVEDTRETIIMGDFNAGTEVVVGNKVIGQYREEQRTTSWHTCTHLYLCLNMFFRQHIHGLRRHCN